MYIHICTYSCINEWKHRYIYIYVSLPTCIMYFICTCIHTCTYACIYMCVCVCLVYTYIHVYMYIHALCIDAPNLRVLGAALAIGWSSGHRLSTRTLLLTTFDRTTAILAQVQMQMQAGGNFVPMPSNNMKTCCFSCNLRLRSSSVSLASTRTFTPKCCALDSRKCTR